MSNSGSSRSTATNVFSTSGTFIHSHAKYNQLNRYNNNNSYNNHKNNNNRGVSVRKTGDIDIDTDIQSSDGDDASDTNVMYVKKSSHLRNSSSKNCSYNTSNSYYTILLLLLPHLTFTVQIITPLLPLTLSHQLTNFLFL